MKGGQLGVEARWINVDELRWRRCRFPGESDAFLREDMRTRLYNRRGHPLGSFNTHAAHMTTLM